MAPFSVVICSGAFCVPEHYQPLIDTLQSKGIEAACPLLPTNDACKTSVTDPTDPIYDAEAPPSGWPTGNDDVRTVRAEIDRCLAQSSDVILLAHSQGGWIASEAAAPELQKKNRRDGHGVIGIYYVSAEVIPKGESSFSFNTSQGGPFQMPPFMAFHRPGVKGLVTPCRAAEFFFSDLPTDEAEYFGSIMRAKTVPDTVQSNAAYLDLPCAFLACECDNIFPVAQQMVMISVSKDRGGDMKVYHSPSGHFPMLTWKEGLVSSLEEFASSL